MSLRSLTVESVCICGYNSLFGEQERLGYSRCLYFRDCSVSADNVFPFGCRSYFLSVSICMLDYLWNKVLPMLSCCFSGDKIYFLIDLKRLIVRLS